MARASRTLLIIAALVVTPALTASAQVSVEVQLHGAPLITSLHSQLFAIEGYRFENLSRAILALDARTGEHLYTISHPDRDCLTFNAAIVKLGTPSLLVRNRVRMEIERFNRITSVGTLYFDESTAQITLRHHLDPGQVGIRSMVEVARRFGAAVVTERGNLDGLAAL